MHFLVMSAHLLANLWRLLVCNGFHSMHKSYTLILYFFLTTLLVTVSSMMSVSRELESSGPKFIHCLVEMPKGRNWSPPIALSYGKPSVKNRYYTLFLTRRTSYNTLLIQEGKAQIQLKIR